MERAMKNLAALMRRTDRVRITVRAQICRSPSRYSGDPVQRIPQPAGRRNLYRAGARFGKGRVRFTAPTIYQSVVHENVELVFRNGKIIRAKSDKSELLNAVRTQTRAAGISVNSPWG
jgi:hypothetical protein